MNTQRILCLTAAAALLLSACGGAATETEAETAAPATTQSASAEDSAASVSVKNIAFKPADMKVLRGTEVTWTNDDDVAHTATSGKPGTRAVSGVSKGSPAKVDGVFNGDLAKAGATYRFTFNKPGTFAYFCEIHPSMTGEIVVE